MEADYHIPVLADEAVEALIGDPSGIYVDATLGGGGYSERIAKKLSTNGIVLGFDTDTDAIEFATKRLAEYGSKVRIVRENFSELRQTLSNIGISSIDGIVYDLGVSSHQLDTTATGLSYRFDSELDMRLDKRLTISALEIIADYSESELTTIFRKYGEEPTSKRIARRIVDRRVSTPIRTTFELADIVGQGIRPDKRSSVLSRIFQAIRIEVNDELGRLERSLEQAVGILKPGARILVVSYHSLEDRIVKDFFALESRPPAEAGSLASLKDSVDLTKARLTLIVSKPIVASEAEISRNVRSRSAKLRIAQKI